MHAGCAESKRLRSSSAATLQGLGVVCFAEGTPFLLVFYCVMAFCLVSLTEAYRALTVIPLGASYVCIWICTGLAPLASMTRSGWLQVLDAVDSSTHLEYLLRLGVSLWSIAGHCASDNLLISTRFSLLCKAAES